MYPTARIALFNDRANLYSAARALNLDLDFRNLLGSFREKAVLVRACYDTAVTEGEGFSPIRLRIDWGRPAAAAPSPSVRTFTDEA